MLVHGPAAALKLRRTIRLSPTQALGGTRVDGDTTAACRVSIAGGAIKAGIAMAAAVMVASSAWALDAPPEAETLENVPQTLSGECTTPEQECRRPRIQRPNSRKAEKCTSKCVTTCVQGGYGAPGEGPFNVRRYVPFDEWPLIVFKEGFRSRRYCLVECSDVCNLIGDQDDGP